MENALATNVWAMSGFIISYTPGALVLEGGRITYLNGKGEQFNVPLNQVQNVKWPRMQMGYGVHLEVNGKKYKFTFIKPSGENSFDVGGITSIGRIANGIESLKTLSHLKEYKVEAVKWREVLGG